MSTSLTDYQLFQLETTERIASCLSLVGTSFVFFTFIYSPAFRKPVNRLLFFATWGNMACNVATLLSQTGIRAGAHSRLCQFQGFLIQMFLPADALWNLAMAINVYMTLFHKYNASQLKSLEWRYHLMCYGGPFIIGFIYIFITTEEKGPIFGPATLWCWIDIKWVALRIATCYAPAWCCILLSFCIYAISGREIFIKRQQLRAFNNAPTDAAPVENPFTDYKITQIEITSELATLQSPDLTRVFLSAQDRTDRQDTNPSPSGKHYDPYTVTIGSAPLSPSLKEGPTNPTGVTEKTMSPPTVPRLDRPPSTKASVQQRKNRAALEANAAAWGYTKVAMLFFVSLLITWVPSSVNRVYSLIHPQLISVPFTYASGVVLPLMGFWNSVIYVTTSWQAVRLLFTGKLSGHGSCPSSKSSLVNKRASLGSRRARACSDSESSRVLAFGRKGSGYDQV